MGAVDQKAARCRKV